MLHEIENLEHISAESQSDESVLFHYVNEPVRVTPGDSSKQGGHL